MKVRMDFIDGATDFFKEFQKVNFGLVKEGLSRASSQLSAEYKKTIKAEEPSEWSSYKQKRSSGKKSKVERQGKRRLTLLDKKKEFGLKHDKATGNPIQGAKWKHQNIADHVAFYVPKELDKLYAVVGGGHPSFRPIRYENGIPKGHLGRVTATTQDTLEILDRLNDGGHVMLTKKAKGFLASARGRNSKQVGDSVYIKPRHFAESARARGGQRALQKVRELYEENFQKAVNNIKPKQVKIQA